MTLVSSPHPAAKRDMFRVAVPALLAITCSATTDREACRKVQAELDLAAFELDGPIDLGFRDGDSRHAQIYFELHDPRYPLTAEPAVRGGDPEFRVRVPVTLCFDAASRDSERSDVHPRARSLLHASGVAQGVPFPRGARLLKFFPASVELEAPWNIEIIS